MNLPAELCGRIAHGIRDSSRAALRTKSRADWLEENKSLLSLSLLSKRWSHEVIRVLWSDVFITFLKKGNGGQSDRTFESAEDQLSRILSVVNGLKSGHAVYLERLTIDVAPAWNYSSSSELDSAIHDILSFSSHLNSFNLTYHTPNAIELPSLHFPHLRVLSIGHQGREDGCIRWAPQEALDVGTFLLHHPGLEEVHFYLPKTLASHWEPVRQADPLPNIEIFRGHPSELMLFGASRPVVRMKLIMDRGDRDHPTTFNQILSEISSPFPNVTHLSLDVICITLNRETLQVFSQCFPALEHIHGLTTSDSFIDFMKSDIEKLSSSLPRLECLMMSCISRDGTIRRDCTGLSPTPSTVNIEQAFLALERLFPEIFMAVHKLTDFDAEFDTRTTFWFEDDGVEIERGEEVMDWLHC